MKIVQPANFRDVVRCNVTIRGVNGNGNTGKNVLPLPVTVLPVKNRLLPKNGNNLIWMFLHEIWGKMCKIKGFCKTRSIQSPSGLIVGFGFGFWLKIGPVTWFFGFQVNLVAHPILEFLM